MSNLGLGAVLAPGSCFNQLVIKLGEMGNLEKRGKLYLLFCS